MNKKIFIGLVGLLLLFFLTWRLWPTRQLPTPAASTQSQPASIPTLADVPNTQQSIASFAGEPTKSSEEKQQQYLEKARSMGESLNRPGNFYGQILDQDNQPVAGVTIKCGLSQFSDIVRPGLMPHYDEFERTTDTAGRFAVEGKSGLALDLKLVPKQGYEFNPAGLQVMLRDQGPNKPAPTLSKSGAPYIFRAFRKGHAEMLLRGSIFYLCEQDGRPYVVSFRDNRIGEGTGGGELKISVRRPPGWANQTDYDWAVRIDAVNMELLETQDIFMYQAPASGYASSWIYSQKAGGENYTREVNPKFYLKGRDGSTYGRIEMSLISNYRDKFGVRMSYWLNPSGSRNLEFDPAKAIPAVKP